MKYVKGSVVEAKTTKMVTAGVELSVEVAIVSVLSKLDNISP